MLTLLSFLIAMGILVTIHEFGHYQVAKWCGVKILRFSVGFGQPIFMKKLGKDQTEFAIAAIPLGGYVKMLGEDAGEELSAQEAARAFSRQPVLKRMAIVVAGPLANLLLALVLYWGLFYGYGESGLRPVLSAPVSGSAAQKVGFQAGDTIVAVNQTPTPAWQDVHWQLLQTQLNQNSADITVKTESGETVLRQLSLKNASADDPDNDMLKQLGLELRKPTFAPIIGDIMPDSAAAKAGLRSGDYIVQVQNKPVADWENFVKIVRTHAGQPLSVNVQRNGKVMNLTITPESTSANGANATVGKIGASFYMSPEQQQAIMITTHYSAWAAVEKSWQKTWQLSAFSLKMLGRMLIGQASLKGISGPVSIASYAGQSAQIGLKSFIAFLALVSISLGVLNLLPVPILDGGHLMYYTIELIRGAPLSARVMEFGQRVGLALLGTLMIIAFYNDFMRYLAPVSP